MSKWPHLARLADAEIIGAADLILTMTAEHKESLEQLFPQAANKVSTLGNYAWGGDKDIADPFGGGQEEYGATRQEIEGAVTIVAMKLRNYIQEVRGMKEKLINLDIDDPYGKSYDEYKRVSDEIEKELIKIINNIHELEEL